LSRILLEKSIANIGYFPAFPTLLLAGKIFAPRQGKSFWGGGERPALTWQCPSGMHTLKL